MRSHSKKLYGKETKLAVDNFAISGWSIPTEVIDALSLIKEKAAITNGKLNCIPKGHAKAIERAAKSIRNRKDDMQFPVDVFQTGSGTSSNMNMNEVLATLASTKQRTIHANDHVNCCQSSNDVFPSAVQIACAVTINNKLLPVLKGLQKTCKQKEGDWKSILKNGRTHMMDAVPLSLGAEFGSYADLLEKSYNELRHATMLLSEIPLGGTAIGTGINAHPRFAKSVIALLKKETRLALSKAKNSTASQSCPLAMMSVSTGLITLSTVLNKIANDIRLMGSGPTSGLQEIFIPELQKGSSIMPGKVNPVLCESVAQVHMFVSGAHTTIQAALTQASIFELNTALPIMAHSLLSSITVLSNVIAIFDEKCMVDLQPNTDKLADTVMKNPMLATALNEYIGYDKASKIAKKAMQENTTVLEAAKSMTDIPEKKLKKILDPTSMIS